MGRNRPMWRQRRKSKNRMSGQGIYMYVQVFKK